jgi:hypothetical protein
MCVIGRDIYFLQMLSSDYVYASVRIYARACEYVHEASKQNNRLQR